MSLNVKLRYNNVILASQSPRREELLRGIITNFTTKTKPVEEVYPSNLSTEEIATYLSNLKASAFENDLEDDDIVITADTIVCLGDTILGKPKDLEEATEMLTLLSGKTHEVITGVTFLSKEKRISFWDKTAVTFYPLTAKEINFYVEDNEPYDKAGAYGIQEWMGYIAIKEIKGDYYNVMGLPLHKVYRKMLKFIS